MKKVAISQSNYIPWKGYFDMIASVDEFVLFDDMQYTRRDWRNRNLIKTPTGLTWLTVPVSVKGKYHQSIFETEINGFDWAETHWKTILQNYKRSPYFEEISSWLEPIYRQEKLTHLSVLNNRLIRGVCDYLSIKTKISQSSDYDLIDGKTERLADICRQAAATDYISGPAAQNYIDETVFEALGIRISWFNYDGYKEYPQLWGAFTHGVTILDLLFNCGKDAPKYMRYVRS